MGTMQAASSQASLTRCFQKNQSLTESIKLQAHTILGAELKILYMFSVLMTNISAIVGDFRISATYIGYMEANAVCACKL